MEDRLEKLRSILSRTQRLESEIAAAQIREVRRTSFEALCARYCDMAREVGKALDCTFPAREPRRDDFGLSVGIVRPAALQDLAGLTADLKSAIKRKLEVFGAIPCPKFAGRPCHLFQEINPDRFDVFFAFPFKEPETCKGACDVLIEWLKTERGIDESRIFRADMRESNVDLNCKICKAIQESCVVVVDITMSNPNVFLEMGFVIGLGKPTILIYDEYASMGDPKATLVPSDIQGRPYVKYDGKKPFEEEWLEHFAEAFDKMMHHRRVKR